MLTSAPVRFTAAASEHKKTTKTITTKKAMARIYCHFGSGGDGNVSNKKIVRDRPASSLTASSLAVIFLRASMPMAAAEDHAPLAAATSRSGKTPGGRGGGEAKLEKITDGRKKKGYLRRVVVNFGRYCQSMR